MQSKRVKEVQREKGKRWTKKEIANMFLFQSANGLTDIETIEKYGITSYVFGKWKKQRQDIIKKNNNSLLQASYTNVELSKDKYDIELLEKKKKVLNATVERMLVLIPKEEDLNKLSNALKAIIGIEGFTKELNPDTNRSAFAEFLEKQSKSIQETKMLLERRGNYQDAEIVE